MYATAAGELRHPDGYPKEPNIYHRRRVLCQVSLHAIKRSLSASDLNGSVYRLNRTELTAKTRFNSVRSPELN